MLSKYSIATALAASSLALGGPCPPHGAVLPAPKSPGKTDYIKSAAEELTAALDKFTAGYNTSGISVQARSIHEDKPFFSYHHTPAVLSDVGVSEIDSDTIYRVGSVSKMITALAVLLIEDLDLNASVLDFLPELADVTYDDDVEAVDWEHVTVQSLANHLSGLATDSATDMSVFPLPLWQDMGLPEAPEDHPECSGLGTSPACQADDIIDYLSHAPPTYSPFNQPVYSNLAYAVLGMVVEAASGEKFADFVQKNIFDVAGMNSTFFDGADSSDLLKEKGFIPLKEGTWNRTLGVYEPTGGMFSTANDLTAFASAILENRLLSPAETRQWMKPESFTSSMSYSIGHVWEITRSENITSDGRVVTVYTKSGDLGGYHALVITVPDYDVVMAVLTGGKEVSTMFQRDIIGSKAVSILIPAVEQAGRDEAEMWQGEYTDEATNSSFIVTADDGAGLVIEEFRVRDYDVLAAFPTYGVGALETGGSTDGLPPVDGRLYPAGRTSAEPNEDGLIETIWRGVFDTTTDEERAEIDSQLYYSRGSCMTWALMDRSFYNRQPLAEFSFLTNEDGEVVGMKNRAFDVTLTKTSSSSPDDSDDSDNGDQPGDSDEPEQGADQPSAASMTLPQAVYPVYILGATALFGVFLM